MHLSFLSGAPHFLLFSIICRALSCATLFQLISKQFAVSACAKHLPMSEVWPTWRLSAGNLFYYLRPFHYLNHPPHTPAASVLISKLYSFSHACIK